MQPQLHKRTCAAVRDISSATCLQLHPRVQAKNFYLHHPLSRKVTSHPKTLLSHCPRISLYNHSNTRRTTTASNVALRNISWNRQTQANGLSRAATQWAIFRNLRRQTWRRSRLLGTEVVTWLAKHQILIRKTRIKFEIWFAKCQNWFAKRDANPLKLCPVTLTTLAMSSFTFGATGPAAPLLTSRIDCCCCWPVLLHWRAKWFGRLHLRHCCP